MNDFLSSSPLRLLGTRDSVSGLAAIDTTILKNGAIVYVTSPGEYFSLKKDSTVVADGAVVVAPINGDGRWFRLPPAEGVTEEVTDWYVSETGSASASGTSSADPITTTELARRVANTFTSQNVNIHVLSALTTPIYIPDSYVFAVGTKLRIVQDTVPTQLASSTVGTWTAQDLGTQQRATLTDPAIADFTPYIGSRVVFPGGPAAAWIIGAPGANTAYLTAPRSTAVVSILPSLYTPVAAEAYVIETPAEVPGIINRATSLDDVFDFSACVGFHITSQAEESHGAAGGILFNCDIEVAQLAGDTVYPSTSLFSGSLFLDATQVQIQGGGGIGGTLTTRAIVSLFIGRDPVFNGMSWRHRNGSCILTTDIGIFDADGLTVLETAKFRCFSGTWCGDGNSDVGISLQAGCVSSYAAGQIPIITGAGGDVKLGINQAATAYGALPLFVGTPIAAGLVEDSNL